MSAVDLVYDEACPNASKARSNLLLAFSRVGMPAKWTEHQIGAGGLPERVRGFGSPTILVGGVDVEGTAAGAETCCRLYGGDGAPDVAQIVAALRRSRTVDNTPSTTPVSAEQPPRSRWRSTAAALPGIGVALMPKVICPLCWSAYAAVLSATGLAFLMEDRWFLPISVVFLLATLGALAWRARLRWGYGPLGIGAASSAAILGGKFAVDSTVAVRLGVVALVAACLWNAWPRRAGRVTCPSCEVPEAVEPNRFSRRDEEQP